MLCKKTNSSSLLNTHTHVQVGLSIFNARGHTKFWYSCLLASYYLTTAEQISHNRTRKIKHTWVCSHTIHSLDWSFSSVFLVKHFSLFQRSSLHTYTTYHTSYVGSLPNSAAEIFFSVSLDFLSKSMRCEMNLSRTSLWGNCDTTWLRTKKKPSS